MSANNYFKGEEAGCQVSFKFFLIFSVEPLVFLGDECRGGPCHNVIPPFKDAARQGVEKKLNTFNNLSSVKKLVARANRFLPPLACLK